VVRADSVQVVTHPLWLVRQRHVGHVVHPVHRAGRVRLRNPSRVRG
jgi:hypothetical protein